MCAHDNLDFLSRLTGIWSKSSRHTNTEFSIGQKWQDGTARDGTAFIGEYIAEKENRAYVEELRASAIDGVGLLSLQQATMLLPSIQLAHQVAKPLVVAVAPCALQAASLVHNNVVGQGPAIAAVEGMDLNQVRVRLEGWTSYGVIAALILNACIRIYSSTPKRMVVNRNDEGEAVAVAKVVFMISVISSILSGCYTTVVFSLLGIYSKAALGLGLDAPVDMSDGTLGVRKSAFNALFMSLITFETSFVSSLFISHDNVLRWWAVGIAATIAGLSFWQWSGIMSIASRLMFS